MIHLKEFYCLKTVHRLRTYRDIRMWLFHAADIDIYLCTYIMLIVYFLYNYKPKWNVWTSYSNNYCGINQHRVLAINRPKLTA